MPGKDLNSFTISLTLHFAFFVLGLYQVLGEELEAIRMNHLKILVSVGT